MFSISHSDRSCGCAAIGGDGSRLISTFRAGDAFEPSLLTRRVARGRLRREPCVGSAWWRSGRRATRRCATDFRRVGSVEDELLPSRSGSVLSALREVTRPGVHAWSRSLKAPASRELDASGTRGDAKTSNQAMQLTASKLVVYTSSACRRHRMLRYVHRGLAAADLVSR